MPTISAMAIFNPRTQPPGMAALFIGEAGLAKSGGEAGEPRSWTMVPLPYRCSILTEPHGCVATFRIPYQPHPTDDRLRSFYLPSFRGELTVSLNGAFLASSRWQ